MKRAMVVVGLMVAALGSAAVATKAGQPEKWLHVRVDNKTEGEVVKVNVPLSLAEKILPTIHEKELHDGKVTIGHADLNGVDLRQLLAAVRDTPDSEFVSVEQRDQTVHVAKQNGNFVIHVVDKNKGGQKVDVIVPMKVVDALVSSGTDELDIVAAIHALGDAGETTLVTVQDEGEGQTVRIWVDSKNTTEK
ncbi:MAG: hypothetical protein ACRD50_13675 [Candidatus Acidiferrales bacterium]